MARKYPRLNAFEILPEATRPLVQEAVDNVVGRRMTQTDAFTSLRAALKEQGLVAEGDIPSFQSFHRLIIREIPFAQEQLIAASKSGMEISPCTKRLLAAALRSLADDLDATGGKGLSAEVGAAISKFLGVRHD